MLRSYLCDYSDAYVVVERRITVEGDNDSKTKNIKLIFKNNALFRSCIWKINNTLVSNTENLDTVMPIHNLWVYNNNDSMTSGSFGIIIEMK